jgi:hypothetical protein
LKKYVKDCVRLKKYKSQGKAEAEFLDEIQSKVFTDFLLAIDSHLYSLP